MFWRNEDLGKCSASSAEGVQLLFWQLQHSIIRLQPHRARFGKALKCQISFIYLLVSMPFIFQAVLQL